MNDGGWIGLASIAITGVLGLVQLAIKSRHDEKLKDQATKIVTLEAAQVECKAESQECREEHAATKTALESTRKELAARDAKDKEELQNQINTLRAQVATKKDKTETSPPI